MRRRVQRAVLVSAMVVTALNIPLGATILGLWSASVVAGDQPITMAAVGTFVVVAGAAGIALTLLLGHLGSRHDVMVGRSPHVRRHASWLRSMSGERVRAGGDRERLDTLDVVCITVVAVTIVAFEIWFAFYSGSPLDGRTGRD